MKQLILLFLCLFPLYSFAQTDSLLMVNGDVIVGEVKKMDKGVVEIETDYSDSNFKIEWSGIKELTCHTYFLVTLSNGTRLNGRITSTNPKLYHVITDDQGTVDVKPEEIVYLKSVEKSFMSKMSANFDLGYSFAKANNLSQLNASGVIGYLANRWSLNLSLNSLRSTQDDVDAIERNDGTLTGNYFLPHDFYATAAFSYLSNTEQSINLRTTTSLGIGWYIIHTNAAYLGISTGASFLSESFDETLDENDQPYIKPSNTDAEWYLQLDVNLFDTGDLSFNSNIKGYRTIGVDRWRTDLTANIKYDLPYDFYIKAGTVLNYDSQPAEPGKEVDYQYTLGFGWEL